MNLQPRIILLLCLIFSGCSRLVFPPDVELAVYPEEKMHRVGNVVCWNIGRGTYYSQENDPLHPEWRTPEMVASVQALSQIRPANNDSVFIRFSGLQIDGSLGNDGYHFWDYVDPAHTPAPEDNMSVHEYMSFITESGAEPLVTLNYSSGTASEAADYVKYLNGTDPTDTIVQARQFWGQSSPYNVKTFEIGNEVFGPWNTGYSAYSEYSYANPSAHNGGDPSWYGKPSSDPANYAGRAMEYITAVTAVAPFAKFNIVLNLASFSYWGGMDASLEALRPLLIIPAVEGVVIHQYNLDEAAAGNGPIDEIPEFWASSSSMYEGNYRLLKEKLDGIPRYGLPLKIAVTEHHVADGFSKGKFKYEDTIIPALGVADNIILFLNVGVELACVHLSISFQGTEEFLYEPWYNPFYLDSSGQLEKKPVYNGVKLVAGHLGRWVVRKEDIKMKDIDGDLSGLGYTCPVLHWVAMTSEDQSILSLIFLNRKTDYPLNVRIKVGDKWHASSATVLSSKSLYSNYVEEEIGLKSLELSCRNGIVGIRLQPSSITGIRLIKK